MGQLGLAFVKLTKFETEELAHDSQRIRAADMRNVATAAVKASRLYRELNAQTVKHLVRIFPWYLVTKKWIFKYHSLHYTPGSCNNSHAYIFIITSILFSSLIDV